MKRTLYYDVEITEDSKDYRMRNDGFIIASVEDEQIVSIEGVFTCDYLKAKMVDSKFVMQYYALQGNCKLAEEFRITIPKSKIELPINIAGEGDGGVIKIITTRRIKKEETQKEYEMIIKAFKENSVFQ